MSTPDALHVPDRVLAGWAHDRLPEPAAWSVEAHLSSCARCRAVLDTLATPVGDAHLDVLFRQVRTAVACPAPTWQERLLARLGVPDSTVRLLVVTPLLTVPWLLGVVVVLACVVALTVVVDPPRAATGDGLSGAGLFLIVAPLLPLAGVGAAFGAHADPSHDLARAAPCPAGRLLLLRTIAVVATTVPLTVVAALAAPTVGWAAIGWILPSLALAACALALTTWIPAGRAVAVATAAWALAVLAMATSVGDPASVVTTASAQTTAAAVGTAMTAWWWARRQHVDVVA